MSFELDRLANQLDWNLLRTFMVIVQERSITSAAMRLNVTQPSISAALRRLEERLDIKLIDRGSGRTFTITPAGEKVYQEALEMYGGVVRLNDLGKTDTQSLSGNIVIYRSSHLDFHEVNLALAEFRELHPGVTYSVTATQCADVVRALQQRIATIGFCTRPDSLPQLERHEMQSQQFAFYCGSNHPLYQVTDPSSSLLATTDVVGFDGETLTGALSQVARWRVRHELGENLIATASSVFDLIEMVEQMPVVGAMAVGHAERHGNTLWRLPLPKNKNSINVDMYAVTDTDRHSSLAERTLIEVFDKIWRWGKQ